MKRRKKLNDLRIGGLKCLFAIVLPLAMISHAQAAVDVLDLWNFNNSAGADGSFPGVYYTSPGATDAAYYDDPSKSIIDASSGIFATSSKVNVSTLGVMGYTAGATPAGWGTFAGTTGGTDHALAVETYNYVNGSVYNGVTYTGPTTLVTNNGITLNSIWQPPVIKTSNSLTTIGPRARRSPLRIGNTPWTAARRGPIFQP